MTYTCGLDKNPYCHWWKEKIVKIEYIEIQASSNNEPTSPKFISFSLLRDKFNHFNWHTTAVLMKIPIIVDKKKKLQKENNYAYDNSDNSDGKSKSRLPKFIRFLLLIDQDVFNDLQLQFW